jgi:cytochrome c nitrite reductase small subunit
MRKGTIVIIVIAVLMGLAAGIGSYTFLYAKGASYMTDDPEACANCHVMNEQFGGWIVSSHRAVAVCNDCHTPAGFIPKYFTKASNGFWHSFAFTTGWFHEPIQIRQSNQRVTEKACRKCHDGIVVAIEGIHEGDREISCIRCHDQVGHP